MTQTRIPDGPSLIVLPDKNAQVASVQVWFPAGPAVERPGEDGLAHFLEHMVFKGSRNLGVGELAARVEAAGGDTNAYTMSDATYYYLVCLPEAAEACAVMLADAVWWPKFSTAEIERERGVILAELDRSEDQPDQVLQQYLFERAYGKMHPYGRPIMGAVRSVKRFDAAALRRFHRRCYAPEGCVVVASGNVSAKGMRRALAGKIKAENRSKKRVLKKAGAKRAVSKTLPMALPMAPPPEPKGRGPRAFVVRERSGLAHLEMAFRIPEFRHEDAPSLEVLAMILGMGESSRLYKRVCVGRSLMHEVTAENFFAAGEGLLFLGGLTAPGRVAEAAGEILRVAREIIELAPPTPEEMARARVNFLADMEFRREGMGGYARIAGYARLMAGRVGFAENYLDRLLAVTAEDVSRVAASWIRLEGLTSGVLIPEGANGGSRGGPGGGSGAQAGSGNGPNGPTRGPSGGSPGGLGARELHVALKRGFEPLEPMPQKTRGLKPLKDRPKAAALALKEKGRVSTRQASTRRASMRRASTRRASKGKDGIHRFTLPGGARLLVRPGGAARVIAIRAVALGGQRLEAKNEAGLHNLMSSVAPQATASMSSEAMAARIDGLGALVEGFSGRNSIGLSASGISGVSDELIEIVSEILTKPRFAADDLDLVRREIAAERRGDMDDLGNLARLRAMALLYSSHPFGRHPLGNSRVLAQLTPAILRRTWRRWISPQNNVLSVAGDIDPGDVAEKFKLRLNDWAKDSYRGRLPRNPEAPSPPTKGRSRRYVVERASQSHIQLVFMGADFHDSRRYALSILTTALGSQGGGLFWELRERRGLAYAVYASSEEGLAPGPISFYAATGPEDEEKAIGIFHNEFERVRQSGLELVELERAKAFLIGDYLRSLQRAGARALEVAFDELYGLDKEGPESYKSKIQSVSNEDVIAVARELLAPGKEAMVRLGPLFGGK
ncbi:MAG: insulinase family protein [Nitrospinaceae bacterium]|nr:insulinase family protein [Nitrospinaceae bacterium]